MDVPVLTRLHTEKTAPSLSLPLCFSDSADISHSADSLIYYREFHFIQLGDRPTARLFTDIRRNIKTSKTAASKQLHMDTCQHIREG